MPQTLSSGSSLLGKTRAIRWVPALAFLCSFSMVGIAAAEQIPGGFCKVAEFRVNNAQKEMLHEKLWEYTEAKVSPNPVLGWVEVACADSGSSRSPLQDFGKRIWFNIAPAEGGPADVPKFTFSESPLTSKVGDVGIGVHGTALYGEIAPRHDCAFTVAIWSEKCAGH